MKKTNCLLMIALFVVACGSDTGPADDGSIDPDCNGGKCDIIGDDDRADEFQGEVTEKLRETARSTAAIVANESLTPDGDFVQIAADTLGDSYQMCSDVRFREQPAGAFCSAWLVAPDVMVTNGHCITSQQACEASSFVFDYTLAEESTDLSSVPAANVYACERVLAWDYTSDCDVDYAVVKLAREVQGREPLPVRGADDELDADNLVIIGHPFGLPRKYALLGKVLKEGDNTFTSTHDIFGGNSGSGIFDANTGEVQGLVTCGGSNLTWEWIDSGWELDRKTGQPCDTSCDAGGEFTDGSWEECADGARRRCVCDGEQLVWESRICMPFETDTGGQCSREAQFSEFECESAPWLCPTPTMQNTRHFAHYVGSWDVYSSDEAIDIPESEQIRTSLTIEDEGSLQALTVHLDLLGDEDPELFSWEFIAADLTILLSRGDEEYELTGAGIANVGSAFDLSNTQSGTQPTQVPFMIDEAVGRPAAGEWTLSVINSEAAEYTLHSWSLQARIVEAEELVEAHRPCVEDCELGWEEGPEEFVETFEGEANDLEGDVTGTIADGWQVGVLDENGSGYEAIKTRRSQTISLQTGEMELVRDFEENIGGRQLTIDYRYDGDGWFQVWADDQILISKQSFAQSNDQVAIPITAPTRIRIVLGATDDSQYHEATIFNVELSSTLVSPASCSSIVQCVSGCGDDQTCIDACVAEGSMTEQDEFYDYAECLNQFCADPDLTDTEYNDCVASNCATELNACTQ